MSLLSALQDSSTNTLVYTKVRGELVSRFPPDSPSLFHDTVSKYKGTSPPADFSILLLALCLLAWNPSANSSIQQNPALLKNIYVTVQILFARVQVPLCALTSLILASLVIAAFKCLWSASCCKYHEHAPNDLVNWLKYSHDKRLKHISTRSEDEAQGP